MEKGTLISKKIIDEGWTYLYSIGLAGMGETFLIYKKAMKVVDYVICVTGRNFKTDNSFQKCTFPWSLFYICWDRFVVPCCAKPFPKELKFDIFFNSDTIVDSASCLKSQTLWLKNIPQSFCDKCNFIDIEPVKPNSKTSDTKN